jgi:hypothetical protein
MSGRAGRRGLDDRGACCGDGSLPRMLGRYRGMSTGSCLGDCGKMAHSCCETVPGTLRILLWRLGLQQSRIRDTFNEAAARNHVCCG